MTSERRPLWQPFSEPSAELPSPAEDWVRLLPVERSPFRAELAPEPTLQRTAPIPGTRRPLGPGSQLFSAPDTPDAAPAG